MFFIKLELQR